MSASAKTQLEALKKLVHAAFHVIDDSEENAQTGVVSIDNKIAAHDLKQMAEALGVLDIFDHDDIEDMFRRLPLIVREAAAK